MLCGAFRMLLFLFLAVAFGQEKTGIDRSVWGLSITSPASDEVIAAKFSFLHISFNLTSLLPLHCEALMHWNGIPLSRWLPDQSSGEPGLPILWQYLGEQVVYSKPVPRSLEVQLHRPGPHTVRVSILCDGGEVLAAERWFGVRLRERAPRLSIHYPVPGMVLWFSPSVFGLQISIQPGSLEPDGLIGWSAGLTVHKPDRLQTYAELEIETCTDPRFPGRSEAWSQKSCLQSFALTWDFIQRGREPAQHFEPFEMAVTVELLSPKGEVVDSTDTSFQVLPTDTELHSERYDPAIVASVRGAILSGSAPRILRRHEFDDHAAPISAWHFDPRVTHGPEHWHVVSPLEGRGLAVPPFLLFTLDPAQGTLGSPSYVMHRLGHTEGLTSVLFAALCQQCRSPPPQHATQRPEAAGGGRGGAARVVVDAGANIGFFSVLAGSMGCRVLSWEPSAEAGRLLEASVALNGLQGAVTPLHALLADSDQCVTLGGGGCPMCMSSVRPTATAEGKTGAVRAMRLDRALEDVGRAVREAEACGGKGKGRGETAVLEGAVSEVLLLKVDVDGGEGVLLAGARGLVTGRRVRWVWAELNLGSTALPESLALLADSGYHACTPRAQRSEDRAVLEWVWGEEEVEAVAARVVGGVPGMHLFGRDGCDLPPMPYFF